VMRFMARLLENCADKREKRIQESMY